MVCFCDSKIEVIEGKLTSGAQNRFMKMISTLAKTTPKAVVWVFVNFIQIKQYYWITIFKMIAWYGTENTVKNIDKIIDTNPNIEMLLDDPDFIPQLKKFNPKLLEYISSHPDLIRQTLQLISIPPVESDSAERKYKYPLLAVEMIQSETICIINGIFRQTSVANYKVYLDYLFDMLDQKEILVLLSGYLFRVCNCLLNLRYIQMIEYVYARPEIIKKLLNHCENVSITNVLQLFINLEAAKVDKSIENRKMLKIEIVLALIKNIQENRNNQNSDIVSNCCNVLVEIIEKYYLILDGKQILEPLLTEQIVAFWFSFLDNNNSMVALSVIGLLNALINYYAFSSLNNEDKTNQQFNRINRERLEVQPFILYLNAHFERIIIKINNANKLGVFEFRILELLCHTVTLSSLSVFNNIRRLNFLAFLIDLLFKYEQSNILHNLIEKTFLHIFTNQKRIYEQYKLHIFCEMDIIGRTVLPIIKHPVKYLKTRSNFGYIMKIIKIYPNIQTMNERIINSIKNYTELWNKVAIQIIKPYQELCNKQLGLYDLSNIPEIPLQYKCRQITFIPKIINHNNQIIENVNEQAKFLKPHANVTIQHFQTENKTIIQSDNFFKVPNSDIHIINQISVSKTQQQRPPIVRPDIQIQSQSPSVKSVIQQPKQLSPEKKIVEAKIESKVENIPENTKQNFNQFLEKKKQQATQTIKLQRSTSQQKRLGSRGSRVTSPSPKKKNNWAQSEQTTKPIIKKGNTDKLPNNVPLPQIKKTITQSVIITQKPKKTQQQIMLTRSMVNLNDLKNIKVRFVKQKPEKEKKSRKAQQKDAAFLNFLGILI